MGLPGGPPEIQPSPFLNHGLADRHGSGPRPPPKERRGAPETAPNGPPALPAQLQNGSTRCR
eukprot:2607867-Pyramimonas_sp.AAC.1